MIYYSRFEMFTIVGRSSPPIGQAISWRYVLLQCLRAMSETVTTTVQQGVLLGRKAKTRTGKIYLSFQGIPYAKPPVGSRRFKAPEPPDSWRGERDATEEGSFCPHLDMVIQQFKGVEDSLFLNVYTPRLSSESSLVPVMVWIHGGGFTTGSGNTDFYGPDYLVDAGVILVTFNYRLGAFGFLHLEDANTSGNNGLKDQVAALKWVRQNIKQFGGDPNNVTIFGESAGGASVHYHLLSPMSKGLFQRAIVQSGSALNPWAFTDTSRRRAFALGKLLGCSTMNAQELVNFLRKVPPQDIVETQEKTLTSEDRRGGLAFPFVPSSENLTETNTELFVTDNPIRLISSGSVHQVPFIIGYNSSEGILLLKDLGSDPNRILKKIDSDFKRLIPADLFYLPEDKLSPVIRKVRQFYLANKPLSEKTIKQYVDLVTDVTFCLGIHNTVCNHLLRSQSPIYYYKFVFDGSLGLFKRVINSFDVKGPCHADELGYLFTSSLFDLQLSDDTPEMKTVRRMVQLWTNFAKYGDPNFDLKDVFWKPVTKSNLYYLQIGEDLTLQEDPDKDRIQFWEKVYSSVRNSSKL